MDQNINQNTDFVLLSVESICMPNQSEKVPSENSSHFRSPAPSRSLVAPHTSASSPVELGKARIESSFRTIEYITFREKPACFIVIDVRFIYNKRYQMRSAKIQLNFSKDGDDANGVASYPRTTDAYGPTDSFGDVESISTTQDVGLQATAAFPGYKLPTATFGSSTTRTRNQQWQIQGMRPEAKQGAGQSYQWKVFDNDLSSFDSFPRTVTLWMIVEHNHMPFYGDMHMTGKLRGHMTTNAVTRLNRSYQDKKEASKALAPGALVPGLTADSSIEAAQNFYKWLAAKRGVDGRIFTPPSSSSTATSVRFDEEKLRAALGGLSSGLWSEDILNCTKNKCRLPSDTI